MLCATFGANQCNCLGGIRNGRFVTFRKFAGGKNHLKWWTEMGVAYMMRFNTIQGTCGYKVFECVMNCMGVISQNTLSLIIGPPSCGNSQ